MSFQPVVIDKSSMTFGPQLGDQPNRMAPCDKAEILQRSRILLTQCNVHQVLTRKLMDATTQYNTGNKNPTWFRGGHIDLIYPFRNRQDGHLYLRTDICPSRA
jgi:hypothetical protein